MTAARLFGRYSREKQTFGLPFGPSIFLRKRRAAASAEGLDKHFPLWLNLIVP